MEDRIRLSYFYGKEADQFSFYKIPKLLFTEEYFKKISVEAKVLYGPVSYTHLTLPTICIV